ncbi:MAG: hypothetical protein AVDCRST_MAG66-3334, partial [uncultured Pseudonocardia sp.]
WPLPRPVPSPRSPRCSAAGPAPSTPRCPSSRSPPPGWSRARSARRRRWR